MTPKLMSLTDRLRSARALIKMDRNASQRERDNADLMDEARVILEQPHLYNVEAMAAIHDVLKSQEPSTLPTGHRFWTRDRDLHDNGIGALKAIYRVLTVELSTK